MRDKDIGVGMDDTGAQEIQSLSLLSEEDIQSKEDRKYRGTVPIP